MALMFGRYDKRFLIGSSSSAGTIVPASVILPDPGDSIRRVFSGTGAYLWEWVVIYQTDDPTHLKQYLLKRNMTDATLSIISSKELDIPASEYTLAGGTYTLKTSSYYHKAMIAATDEKIIWYTNYDHNEGSWTPPGYQEFDQVDGLFGAWTAYPAGYDWSLMFHMAIDSDYYYSCQVDTITKHAFTDDSLIAESDPFGGGAGGLAPMTVCRSGSVLFAYSWNTIPQNFLEYDLDFDLITDNGVKCSFAGTYKHIYGGDTDRTFVLVGPYTWASSSPQYHTLSIRKLDLTALTCASLTVEADTMGP